MCVLLTVFPFSLSCDGAAVAADVFPDELGKLLVSD